jgi:ribose/xylose/arabinose/galactoside ABC-type transport system permease subunit
MTSASAPSAHRLLPTVHRLLLSEYLVLSLSTGYFLVMWPFTPGLAEPENLANVLAAMLPLLVVAIGQMFVLISRGIDLSVTSTIALASVGGALVMNAENGWMRGSAVVVLAGIVVMLGLGAVLGAVNGVAVARLRMPPFIVTLTTMMFVSGLAIWLTKSKNIFGLPASFNGIGAQLLPAFVVTAVVASLAHLTLSRTLFGRWLYAIGQNERTAHVSGVPVARVTLGAYVVCGVCAAIAAVLYTGRLETGSPTMGQRILLDVIGATVIGGTSLYGGKGKVLWTVFGVLFLALIDNTLNLQNLSHFTIMMVKGAVILLAAILDATRQKLRSSDA